MLITLLNAFYRCLQHGLCLTVHAHANSQLYLTSARLLEERDETVTSWTTTLSRVPNNTASLPSELCLVAGHYIENVFFFELVGMLGRAFDNNQAFFCMSEIKYICLVALQRE